MQYSEAIDYLYSRLPVFHRIGAKALKPGLGNIRLLCEALGNPQDQFKSIHVGGTNGKGSSSHMLAAIYQSAGYQVGLYTSPHLKSFTERIRISGQPIPEGEVAAFVARHQALIEEIEPSFFEVTVALAFDFFARQAVDLAIIEVGLGGRLDSTNIIKPETSLITNISYDHTDILGDTLAQIAYEKAGIIKAGIPVVIGETHPETEALFRSTASSLKAPIQFADQLYSVKDLGIRLGWRDVEVVREADAPQHFTLDLVGGYQLKNLPGVLAVVSVLQSQFPLSIDAIRTGLTSVTQLTGLKGRFQRLSEKPRVIVDTAHNQAGLTVLFDTVSSIQFTKLRIILGLVADKDRRKILTLFPKEAIYYFCQAHTPRSLSAELLQLEAAEVGLLGEVFTDVNSALQAALGEGASDDLILITGSNYTIAELTNL
ncbi:bifunctional folylpolyglutamate synthase/dihydrofolate synthase [Spirosoma aerophilum]